MKANADLELAHDFLVRAENLGITKDAALDEALSEWLAAHTPPV